MRHLIISDIHERPRTVQAIIKMAHDDPKGPPDRAISLGDWWDNQDPNLQETLDLLLKFLDGDDTDALLGNHDALYFFGDGRFHFHGTRGWKEVTQEYLDNKLMIGERRKFKLASVIQIAKDAEEHAGRLVICSHAGIHPEIWARAGGLAGFEHECGVALDLAFNGDFHRYFDVGGCRGGWARFGGLTWLDWDHEFRPIPDIIQIVGHTYDSRNDPPRVRVKPFDFKTPNFCLDTGLRHYIIVDDQTGKIEIKATP